MPDAATLGLGRIHAPDPRDANFHMAAVLPTESTRTSRYWFAGGWWGDQGQLPRCVGYAWAHWVEDGPVTHKGTPPIISPEDIYNEAQKIDEWAGSPHDGTSVRAGAKALQLAGFIKEYRWAWDIPTITLALLEGGPIVLGTVWYDGMFYPDDSGIIVPRGNIVGGHAYLVDGINTVTGMVRIKNSWGRSWGRRGYAYILMEHLEVLIKQDGEACLALEIPK